MIEAIFLGIGFVVGWILGYLPSARTRAEKCKVLEQVSGFANAYSELSIQYANALLQQRENIPIVPVKDFKQTLSASLEAEEVEHKEPGLTGGAL